MLETFLNPRLNHVYRNKDDKFIVYVAISFRPERIMYVPIENIDLRCKFSMTKDKFSKYIKEDMGNLEEFKINYPEFLL